MRNNERDKRGSVPKYYRNPYYKLVSVNAFYVNS